MNLSEFSPNDLIEIYTGFDEEDEEKFDVGYILTYDDNFCMTKLVDHYGRFLSYSLINLNMISNIISSDDDYLEMIKNFVKILQDENAFNSLSIDNIKYESTNNLIDYILKYQCNNKLLTGFVSNDDKIFGFINSIFDNYIIITEIDYVSLSKKSDIKLFKSNIQQIEYNSILLYLLKNSTYSLLP
ncbi:hypothetical protein EDD66_11013 [Mobilisporobacter senegalensis]|uniref:Uncharacterized protein n=1 Tax=Mobilisporobacter senegalensis TaxID=1329262 RepID=A0A3N1XG17_9FIRM|nr:hypothetical protein [Mobilisporobacter senegalensis]ROR25663.1 hypothetical protein EDD66_11013 [Mobilisporobacter senegalensis]